MQVLALPQSSRVSIAAAILSLTAAFSQVLTTEASNLCLGFAAIIISGAIGDFLTAVAHFAFDYVFPARLPILGPVAREFREHHEYPTLDPRDYRVNFTKGAYCSLPLSLCVIALDQVMPVGTLSFLLIATLFGMSTWAFFFHQIHSYAHMESLPPAGGIQAPCVGDQPFAKNCRSDPRVREPIQDGADPPGYPDFAALPPAVEPGGA